MVAGLNVKFRIWRWYYDDDDTSGGAVPYERVLHESVRGRFQQMPDEQVLLQQGLETLKTFTCVVAPGTLDVKERDEVEVIHPADHYYCGDRFRIVNARPSDFNPSDRRNYLMLSLIRSVEAHNNQ